MQLSLSPGDSVLSGEFLLEKRHRGDYIFYHCDDLLTNNLNYIYIESNYLNVFKCI